MRPSPSKSLLFFGKLHDTHYSLSSVKKLVNTLLPCWYLTINKLSMYNSVKCLIITILMLQWWSTQCPKLLLWGGGSSTTTILGLWPLAEVMPDRGKPVYDAGQFLLTFAVSCIALKPGPYLLKKLLLYNTHVTLKTGKRSNWWLLKLIQLAKFGVT